MLFHVMGIACKEGFYSYGKQVSLITLCLIRFQSQLTDCESSIRWCYLLGT